MLPTVCPLPASTPRTPKASTSASRAWAAIEVEDYAVRRGFDLQTTERWLRPNLD